MTQPLSEDPAEVNAPAKKEWEPPRFLSVEVLEVIAGVCGGVNPLGKDSAPTCSALTS